MPIRLFPSIYLLIYRLSTLLDVKRDDGRDFRRFFEGFGQTYDDIRFASTRDRPTCSAMETFLGDKTFREVVNLLRDLQRNDCVEVIHEAIFSQLKRKAAASSPDQAGTNFYFNAEDDEINKRKARRRKTKKSLESHEKDTKGEKNAPRKVKSTSGKGGIDNILGYSSSMLQRPAVPKSVETLGSRRQSSSVPCIIYQHLKMVVADITSFIRQHIFQDRIDTGMKSSILHVITAANRIVALFLLANDFIIILNSTLTLWSSLHAFSVLEHLSVGMSVIGDWVMMPMVRKLWEIVVELRKREMLGERQKEKKAEIKAKHYTPYVMRRINYIEEQCRKDIQKLSAKEKTEMEYIRKTFLFILPFEITLICIGIYQLYSSTHSLLDSPLSVLNLCIALLILDIAVRSTLISLHYIIVDSTNRFKIDDDYLIPRVEALEQYMKVAFLERQQLKKTTVSPFSGKSRSITRAFSVNQMGGINKACQADEFNAPIVSRMNSSI
uniref:Uncharacterized protein LOC100373295 n=1 Tax=Saccoglossus kowalevskii TaxID=10224 RepID=A0ABM0H0Q1_SACKO|nr:PREDICTED: uncharacterized protein LOC100373295 [Saccoglossus kowalevskii]